MASMKGLSGFASRIAIQAGIALALVALGVILAGSRSGGGPDQGPSAPSVGLEPRPEPRSSVIAASPASEPVTERDSLASPESTSRGSSQPPVEARPEREPESLPALVVPADVAEEPLRLRDWLLALPDEEFARIVGTGQLDRLVTRVVNGLMFANPEATEPPPEMARFVERINERIDRVSAQD